MTSRARETITRFWTKHRTLICVLLLLLLIAVVVVAFLAVNRLGDLANAATFIEVLVVIIAAVYAYDQLREASKSRNLTAAMEMINLLGKKEIKDDIAALDELPKNPNKVKNGQWDQIYSVSHSFNRVGLLVERGLLQQDILLGMYAETIISTWNKLKPYIDHKRETKIRRYQHYFEKLNELSIEFLK